MNKKSLLLTLGLYLFCSVAQAAYAAEVVVFSGRKEPLIKPVIELFEETTGIDVVLKTGKSAALGQQILQEQPKPSADVFIGKESGSLEYLRLKGVFEPYLSDSIKRIPKELRAADGSWIGVSGRSRAVIYNKDLISKEDVPKTLEELTDPKYKGKIAAVNAANESFTAWISALRIQLGDEYVTEFLSKLKANDIVLVSKSHTDIRKAVGRGEYPLGLINHYYYHLQKNETDKALRNVGVVYLDQEKGARGELINVSGAGIVKNAPHMEEAKQFVEFLTSNAAQKLFAEVNFEYPLVKGVDAHPEVLESIGCSGGDALKCLNSMEVSLDLFGPELEATTQLLDEIDWY